MEPTEVKAAHAIFVHFSKISYLRFWTTWRWNTFVGLIYRFGHGPTIYTAKLAWENQWKFYVSALADSAYRIFYRVALGGRLCRRGAKTERKSPRTEHGIPKKRMPEKLLLNGPTFATELSTANRESRKQSQFAFESVFWACVQLFQQQRAQQHQSQSHEWSHTENRTPLTTESQCIHRANKLQVFLQNNS